MPHAMPPAQGDIRVFTDGRGHDIIRQIYYSPSWWVFWTCGYGYLAQPVRWEASVDGWMAWREWR